MLVQVKTRDDVEAVEKPAEVENVQYQHADFEEALANPSDELADDTSEQVINEPMVRDSVKVGRNDPCPCGSGKKYKQCHGILS